MAIDYLRERVPKELHALKPTVLLYPGLGQDIWVPFGVLDAKHVIAWDKVDEHYIPVGWGAGARQKLYGYAVLLNNGLLSMGAKVEVPKYQEDKHTFTIDFAWKKQARSLTVTIQDYNDVETFPKADGVLVGAPMTKTLEQRMLAQSQPAFWMDTSDTDEGIQVVYPSIMDSFLDDWILTDALAHTVSQKSCSKVVWDAFYAKVAEENTQPFVLRRLDQPSRAVRKRSAPITDDHSVVKGIRDKVPTQRLRSSRLKRSAGA